MIDKHCERYSFEINMNSRMGAHLARYRVVGSKTFLEGATLRAAVILAQVLKRRSAQNQSCEPCYEVLSCMPVCLEQVHLEGRQGLLAQWVRLQTCCEGCIQPLAAGISEDTTSHTKKHNHLSSCLLEGCLRHCSAGAQPLIIVHHVSRQALFPCQQRS